jgi:hypothetical protein
VKTRETQRNTLGGRSSDVSPTNGVSDAGRGMMEVVVGLLVADHLNRARSLAMTENRKVAVLFDVEKNVYGIDLNGNGKLDPAESEDLPEGIALTEDCAVVFLPSGNLPPKAKGPQIVLSNNRTSRSISVSSLGSVSVE